MAHEPEAKMDSLSIAVNRETKQVRIAFKSMGGAVIMAADDAFTFAYALADSAVAAGANIEPMLRGLVAEMTEAMSDLDESPRLDA